MNPSEMARAARQAVGEACLVCRRVQHELDDVRAMFKDDKSPVSLADFASQAVVARRLADALGNVHLVGEEDAHELREQLDEGDRAMCEAIVDAVEPVWPDATIDDVLDAIDRGNADPARDSLHGFWTLDPIDGTKGFLRGGQYAVSLAWIENGSPVMGTLGCPNLSADFGRAFDDPDPKGVLYAAYVGEGVWELPADDVHAHGTRVTRLDPAEGEPVRLCESVETAHTSHNESADVMQRLSRPTEPARLDSQAKYAVVARGQADLYLRLPREPKPGKPRYVERIWDHAAGSLVAREAGCAVTDIVGRELDFGMGLGLEANAGVVVAAPGLHGEVLGALRELGITDRAHPGTGG